MVKCSNCGSYDITIGSFATRCNGCGASVDPDTGEAYMDSQTGKVIKTAQFGGIN